MEILSSLAATCRCASLSPLYSTITPTCTRITACPANTLRCRPAACDLLAYSDLAITTPRGNTMQHSAKVCHCSQNVTVTTKLISHKCIFPVTHTLCFTPAIRREIAKSQGKTVANVQSPWTPQNDLQAELHSPKKRLHIAPLYASSA